MITSFWLLCSFSSSSATWNWPVIFFFSFPRDSGLGVPVGRADKVGVFTLPDRHISSTFRIVKTGRFCNVSISKKWDLFRSDFYTCDFQVSLLKYHGIRVHLAHIPSLVRWLYVLNGQLPQISLALNDRNPRVPSHHPFIHSQNSLRFDLDPSDHHIVHAFGVGNETF